MRVRACVPGSYARRNLLHLVKWWKTITTTTPSSSGWPMKIEIKMPAQIERLHQQHINAYGLPSRCTHWRWNATAICFSMPLPSSMFSLCIKPRTQCAFHYQSAIALYVFALLKGFRFFIGNVCCVYSFLKHDYCFACSPPFWWWKSSATFSVVNINDFWSIFGSLYGDCIHNY